MRTTAHTKCRTCSTRNRTYKYPPTRARILIGGKTPRCHAWIISHRMSTYLQRRHRFRRLAGYASTTTHRSSIELHEWPSDRAQSTVEHGETKNATAGQDCSKLAAPCSKQSQAGRRNSGDRRIYSSCLILFYQYT